MGTYKVIQDIEAEDKLLGPLSLRQFIFAIIAVLFYYLTFLVITKHAVVMVVVFLPPALIGTFFAWPWSSDQPTEIWALAKIRFFLKPHKRIWDQSGVKDLVTITAPKKVAEPMRSNGLSQYEVNSRLGALANTIDSRGWAIKNVNINLSAVPMMNGSGDESDRLIDPSSFPQEVPNYEIQAADDILDEQNNPIAQQFDQMINAATKVHRQELVQMMNQPTLSLPTPVNSNSPIMPAAAAPVVPTAPETSKYWFLNRPGQGAKRQRARAATAVAAPVAPVGVPNAPALSVIPAATPTTEEEALGQQIKAAHQQPNDFAGRMKTIQPLGQLPDDTTPVSPVAPAPVIIPVLSPQPDPALLQLATNNDLDVATLARQAHKKDETKGELNDNEVVISLH